MVHCPHCGAEAQPGDVYCHSCGQSLEPSAAAPAKPAIPVTGAPPPAAKPVYSAAPAFEYAGFWRRFAAYLLDAIILSLIGLPITTAMIFFPSISLPWYFFGVNLLSSFITTVIGWIYFWFFESSSYQATPGKMALRIIVTDLNGSRISLGRAAARDLSKILSMLTIGIGFIMIGFTEEKRGLHDYIAGTLVIKKP
jgi:uncharacterized RDD family membrane protein YckC